MWKKIFFALLRYSGIPFLVRHLAASRKATIILYHSPGKENFENHIRYLSSRYNFITLDNLVDATRTKDWSGIPRRALVVTFDDGHRSNYELLPLFEKYRIRPTIYLCSRIIGTHRRYWFL